MTHSILRGLVEGFAFTGCLALIFVVWWLA